MLAALCTLVPGTASARTTGSGLVGPALALSLSAPQVHTGQDPLDQKLAFESPTSTFERARGLYKAIEDLCDATPADAAQQGTACEPSEQAYRNATRVYRLAQIDDARIGSDPFWDTAFWGQQPPWHPDLVPGR